MSDGSASERLSLDEVFEVAEGVLLAHGFAADHAAAIARTARDAEADECHHHGLFRLSFYVAALRAGQASGDARPSLSDLAPGILRCDANGGFAPLALEMAEQPLADRAAAQGIAALALVGQNHIGPLWPEVERLARRGLVAFAFVSALPYVAPAGGTKPLFGTNPMAFGWPRPEGPPLVFDQASSGSSRGEIQIRQRDGREIPEGWAIDADGRPTTDPRAALAGAQLPFGGAKGSSIAMMVELLAGPLIGEVLSVEARLRDAAGAGTAPSGELIMAMDPARFVPGGNRAAQTAHGELLFRHILDQEGTRLPSDRRYAARERTAREGVTIAPALRETLRGLGARI